MKQTTKRRLYILGVLVLSVLAMLALASMKQPQAKKQDVESALLVEVMELHPETVQFTVQSQGSVQPKINTTLSAEVSGSIIYISPNFVSGGQFEPGEVLLRIDPTDYKVAVLQAKSLVKQREIEYQGAKKLRQSGYRAEAELASAEAALAAAEASLVRANRNLERTNIQLPYRGMVRSKLADLGQYVNPGSRVAETFAIETAEIRLPLTDKDLSFLKLTKFYNQSIHQAQGAKVTLSATQQGRVESWQANIVRTEGVVDEKSRVTYAVAEVLDPYKMNQTLVATNEAILPMGTYVTANIEGIEVENIVKVPRSTLRNQNELLFVDKEDKLRIRPVNVLRTDNEFAYINQGVSPGDRICLTAIESPINGMQLRTRSTSQTPAETADSKEAEQNE